MPDSQAAQTSTPPTDLLAQSDPQSEPLRHRIWQRYCDGASYTQIAGDLRLDRATVARHVAAIHRQLADEHTQQLAFARLRAVAAQHAIQERALRGLAAEEEREATSRADLSTAAASDDSAASDSRLPYRAQRARLLAVASVSAYRAARLLGLLDHPAPAPDAPDDDHRPRTILIVRDDDPSTSDSAPVTPDDSSAPDLAHTVSDDSSVSDDPAHTTPSSPAALPSDTPSSTTDTLANSLTASPTDMDTAAPPCAHPTSPLPTGHAPQVPSLLRPSPVTLANTTIHRLHPAQHAFVTSRAPFAFYVGGIGAGKTFAGALRALLHAQSLPGSLGLIGAPTERMLRDAAARAFFSLLPPDLLARYHRTDGRLTLANGAEILLRSLDQPDRVRGLNLAWFWLDEAPWAGHYAWRLLTGRLRQSDVDPARLAGWATGTPRGRDGYARDFELAPRPGHAL